MIGVLLINLGTPDSPSTKDVRKYLREFLSDPRVVDINPISRWMLVNLIIAPFRSPKSAEAYQKIWTKEGSPLLVNTQKLAKNVQKKLGEKFKVLPVMRYGNPSIKSGIETLKNLGASQIRALPLYPQYAASSSASTMDVLQRLENEIDNCPDIKVRGAFFNQDKFLDAWKETSEALLNNFQADHILFSFHGVPERHIYAEDLGGRYCLKETNCCDKLIPANGLCYRAHCVQTAYGIADRLNLTKDQYTICFQSRLGRTKWIEPYTDILISEYAKKGVKRLAVFCPSFVADCLETLEEIGMRAREQFRSEGGEELLLIPSLNDSEKWVEAVSEMILGLS